MAVDPLSIGMTGLSLVDSIIQNQRGKKLQRQAEGMEPPAIDPGQQQMLDDVSQRIRRIESGAEAAPIVSNVQEQAEATQQNIAETTPSAGQAIVGQILAQRNADDAATKAMLTSRRELPYFQNLATGLANKIAQRKLDLTTNRQDRLFGQAARLRTEGNNQLKGSLAAILARLPQIQGSGGSNGNVGSDSVVVDDRVAPYLSGNSNMEFMDVNTMIA